MKNVSKFLVCLILSIFSFSSYAIDEKDEAIDFNLVADGYEKHLVEGLYNFNINTGPGDNYSIETEFTSLEVKPIQLPGQNAIGLAESRTPIEIATITMTQGSKVKFKITDNSTKVVKTIIYKVLRHGEWKTSFGFTFVGLGERDHSNFFLKATGVGNQFEIMESKNEPLKYMPTFMFHYLPNSSLSENVIPSLTAGLGVNNLQSLPDVFLGFGLVIRHNVSIDLGAAITSLNRLKSEYMDQENRIINITEGVPEILRKSYDIRPFFSLSFRFNQNPFTSSM